MRQKVIAGNWKMHKSIYESVEFVQDLNNLGIPDDRRVIVCAPYTSLYTLSQQIEGTNIKLAAQNVHYEDRGAFTGEISPLMLLGTHVEYVIIGHSERRQYFAETDEIVNKKVINSLKNGLKPIICVGETLEQRELGLTMNIIKTQVEVALSNVNEQDITRIKIAYEPVWAIGTGKNATPEDANDVCKNIREIVEKLYSKDIAEVIQILYGGSVKPDNAKQLFNMSDIDGGLIGGASLRAKDFSQIIKYEE